MISLSPETKWVSIIKPLLDNAEADYVVYRLKDLALNSLGGDYHAEHLLRMHEYIFGDIFEWAGVPRTISIYKEEDVLGGQSVEYSDPFDIVNDLHHVLSDMRAKEWNNISLRQKAFEFCNSLARLWKIHPFREGNTRTTIMFCCQFADEMGFPLNRKLFEENSIYVRTARVAYNVLKNLNALLEESHQTKVMDKSFLRWYDIYNSRKDVICMATATATKAAENSYTINDAMEVLFGKLDEAIDDMENGRVQTIEEAWKEIDSI